MKKFNTKVLHGRTILGEIELKERGGKDNRYVYRYKGKTVFSFGITRGTKKKEVTLHYVPKQMGLTKAEYSRLNDCPMSKEDYNILMIEKGNIQDT